MENYILKVREYLKADKHWLLLLIGFLAGIGGSGLLGSIWVGAVLGASLEYLDYSYTDTFRTEILWLPIIGAVLGCIL